MNWDKLSPEMKAALAEEVRSDMTRKEESAMRESMLARILNLQSERGELEAKIKTFLEAFQVGPHPVNEGQIDMVAYDDYGGNPVYWKHENESDEDIARRKALWALWNAVNQK
jgi:hypothetical protein